LKQKSTSADPLSEQNRHPMSLPPRRPHSRPLALELLEPRAVPAALAQIVELPLGSLNYNGYDVVDTSPSGFLVGASNDQQSKLLRFNDQGQLLSEVLLSPLAG